MFLQTVTLHTPCTCTHIFRIEYSLFLSRQMFFSTTSVNLNITSKTVKASAFRLEESHLLVELAVGNLSAGGAGLATNSSNGLTSKLVWVKKKRIYIKFLKKNFHLPNTQLRRQNFSFIRHLSNFCNLLEGNLYFGFDVYSFSS